MRSDIGTRVPISERVGTDFSKFFSRFSYVLDDFYEVFKKFIRFLHSLRLFLTKFFNKMAKKPIKPVRARKISNSAIEDVGKIFFVFFCS